MADFGYVRISTQQQNEERQMIAMAEQGIPAGRIYMDKLSGKDFERPRYHALLRRLKKGDTLFLCSLDRLGRSFDEVQEQWRVITKEKGAGIVVLDMPLLNTRDDRDLTGKLIAAVVLQVLSYAAQHERELIRQRQAQGIAAARARGVKFGRPKLKTPDDFAALVTRWEQKQLGLSKVLAICGMSKTTFYRRAAEHQKPK